MKPIVISDFIAVDYFPRKRGVQYFFLTHAHKDHCVGLNSKWKFGKIYCSSLTAKLLPIVTKKPSSDDSGVPCNIIKPLERNVCHEMEGFFVTLIDANHVIGSVMFLFWGPKIREGVVLCTGDFRADHHFHANIVALNILQQKTIDLIYLDNTYLEAEINEFPTREESLESIIGVIESLQKNDVVTILVNNLGREDLLIRLAKRLNEKIFLSKARMEIMELLESAKYFTNNIEEARIRSHQKWRKLNNNSLVREDSVVINASMLFQLKEECSRGDQINIEYSDHSSPNEIRDFLSILSFRKVVGICTDILPICIIEVQSLSLPAKSENDSTEVYRELVPDENVDQIIAFALSSGIHLNCSPVHHLIYEMTERLNESGCYYEFLTKSSYERTRALAIANSLDSSVLARTVYKGVNGIEKHDVSGGDIKEIKQRSSLVDLIKTSSSSIHIYETVHPMLELSHILNIEGSLAMFSEAERTRYEALSISGQFQMPDDETMRSSVRFDAYKGPSRITGSLRQAYMKLV